MKSVMRKVDTIFPSLLKDLQTLIRQPSVSAKNEGLEECAHLVHSILEKSGIHSEILRLKKDTKSFSLPSPPIVYGEVLSKTNPNKTILFYNHYDVQPVEPIELWNHPPFSAKIIGNKIFGRGATDDKGELITRIKAVESYLKTCGDVPCNVKFVIEGEEETGSDHITHYLKKYRSKFACDGIIWEFGYVDAKNCPIISLGMKGMLYVELTKIESSKDAHSSLAAIIKNPAWRLVDAIHTLRGPDGKILVKDWYKEVQPLSKFDLKLIEKEPFDERSFKKEFKIKEFVANKRGNKAKIALSSEPTCNIAGFHSGYTGIGAKTVLPNKATVKIDFRLVPNMDPKKQTMRLKKHLKSKGFDDINIRIYHAESAIRTDPSTKFVTQIVDPAARKSFGKSIINISNSGTGPMHSFATILKAPCVSIGSTYIFSQIHSPNEFARLDLLRKTTKCMCHIMDKFGNT
jgi:acetylornithine deacetylase/succinyl-diaminopimelate desuccinylase-like protein